MSIISDLTFVFIIFRCKAPQNPYVHSIIHCCVSFLLHSAPPSFIGASRLSFSFFSFLFFFKKQYLLYLLLPQCLFELSLSLSAACTVPAFPSAPGCALGCFLIQFSHPELPKVMQPDKVSWSLWLTVAAFCSYVYVLI